MENIKDELQFYSKFTRPLIFNLPDAKDRVRAAGWVKKIRENESGSERLKTDYIKLLLFALQRKKLVGIFSDDADNYDKLEEFPPDFDLNSMAKTLIQREQAERVDRIRKQLRGQTGDYPPYTTDCSSDFREYAAAQDIPGFGVHCYYAFSKEPLNLWQRADRGIYPKITKSAVDATSPLPPGVSGRSSDPICICPPAPGEIDPSCTAKVHKSKQSPKKKRQKKKLGKSPPTHPLGTAPLPEERVPPTWSSNLMDVKDSDTGEGKAGAKAARSTGAIPKVRTEEQKRMALERGLLGDDSDMEDAEFKEMEDVLDDYRRGEIKTRKRIGRRKGGEPSGGVSEEDLPKEKKKEQEYADVSFEGLDQSKFQEDLEEDSQLLEQFRDKLSKAETKQKLSEKRKQAGSASPAGAGIPLTTPRSSPSPKRQESSEKLYSKEEPPAKQADEGQQAAAVPKPKKRFISRLKAPKGSKLYKNASALPDDAQKQDEAKTKEDQRPKVVPQLPPDADKTTPAFEGKPMTPILKGSPQANAVFFDALDLMENIGPGTPPIFSTDPAIREQAQTRQYADHLFEDVDEWISGPEYFADKQDFVPYDPREEQQQMEKMFSHADDAGDYLFHEDPFEFPQSPEFPEEDNYGLPPLLKASDLPPLPSPEPLKTPYRFSKLEQPLDLFDVLEEEMDLVSAGSTPTTPQYSESPGVAGYVTPERLRVPRRETPPPYVPVPFKPIPSPGEAMTPPLREFADLSKESPPMVWDSPGVNILTVEEMGDGAGGFVSGLPSDNIFGVRAVDDGALSSLMAGGSPQKKPPQEKYMDFLFEGDDKMKNMMNQISTIDTGEDLLGEAMPDFADAPLEEEGAAAFPPPPSGPLKTKQRICRSAEPRYIKTLGHVNNIFEGDIVLDEMHPKYITSLGAVTAIPTFLNGNIWQVIPHLKVIESQEKRYSRRHLSNTIPGRTGADPVSEIPKQLNKFKKNIESLSEKPKDMTAVQRREAMMAEMRILAPPVPPPRAVSPTLPQRPMYFPTQAGEDFQYPQLSPELFEQLEDLEFDQEFLDPNRPGMYSRFMIVGKTSTRRKDIFKKFAPGEGDIIAEEIEPPMSPREYGPPVTPQRPPPMRTPPAPSRRAATPRTPPRSPARSPARTPTRAPSPEGLLDQPYTPPMYISPGAGILDESPPTITGDQHDIRRELVDVTKEALPLTLAEQMRRQRVKSDQAFADFDRLIAPAPPRQRAPRQFTPSPPRPVPQPAVPERTPEQTTPPQPIAGTPRVERRRVPPRREQLEGRRPRRTRLTESAAGRRIDFDEQEPGEPTEIDRYVAEVSARLRLPPLSPPERFYRGPPSLLDTAVPGNLQAPLRPPTVVPGWKTPPRFVERPKTPSPFRVVLPSVEKDQWFFDLSDEPPYVPSPEGLPDYIDYDLVTPQRPAVTPQWQETPRRTESPQRPSPVQDRSRYSPSPMSASPGPVTTPLRDIEIDFLYGEGDKTPESEAAKIFREAGIIESPIEMIDIPPTPPPPPTPYSPLSDPAEIQRMVQKVREAEGRAGIERMRTGEPPASPIENPIMAELRSSIENRRRRAERGERMAERREERERRGRPSMPRITEYVSPVPPAPRTDPFGLPRVQRVGAPGAFSDSYRPPRAVPPRRKKVDKPDAMQRVIDDIVAGRLAHLDAIEMDESASVVRTPPPPITLGFKTPEHLKVTPISPVRRMDPAFFGVSQKDYMKSPPDNLWASSAAQAGEDFGAGIMDFPPSPTQGRTPPRGSPAGATALSPRQLFPTGASPQETPRRTPQRRPPRGNLFDESFSELLLSPGAMSPGAMSPGAMSRGATSPSQPQDRVVTHRASQRRIITTMLPQPNITPGSPDAWNLSDSFIAEEDADFKWMDN